MFVFRAVCLIVFPTALVGSLAFCAEIPLQVDSTIRAATGRMVLDANISGVFPLECGSLEAILTTADGTKTVRKVNGWTGAKNARMCLSMLGLPDGDYAIKVAVKDRNGSEAGSSAAQKFAWKRQVDPAWAAPGLEGLNNLVVELLDARDVQRTQLDFTNPYEGWVFFSCTADAKGADGVHIQLDPGDQAQEIISQDAASGRTAEAMRHLSQGKHTIRIARGGSASIRSLVVRAIPELIYSQFNENPAVTEYGPYDWYYLQKHIVRNVNVMTTLERALKPPFASQDITQIYREYMRWWQDQGKKWIYCVGLPGAGTPIGSDSDKLWKFLRDYPGYTSSFSNSVIVDEYPGASEDTYYLRCAEALDKLYADPKLKDKKFYAYSYGAPMVLGKNSKVFSDAVMNHNGAIALEWYQPEASDLSHVGECVEAYRKQLDAWRSARPDAPRHIVANLGYATQPTWTQSVDPGVDFKVQMDFYMNMLANDPAFCGLYGIAWYSSSSADEEYVRWGSRLFRHYCIEGKTGLLSSELGYRYFPGLIKNPDFVNGLAGWTVSSAEEGSVGTKQIKAFGFLEGRDIDIVPLRGDFTVWTKRSAKAPNTCSQEIVDLKPGRLYSIKMMGTDYQNLMNGKSEYRKHGVSIHIDNVDMLDSKRFQQVIAARHEWQKIGDLFPKFSTYNPVWFNLHQKVFRAKGTTARLTLSDWANDKEPGGPIGQELVYNFVEVQPYYAED